MFDHLLTIPSAAPATSMVGTNSSAAMMSHGRGSTQQIQSIAPTPGYRERLQAASGSLVTTRKPLHGIMKQHPAQCPD